MEKSTGRAIVVGDPNQSLYRFRGADAQAFPRIAEMLSQSRDVVELTLPTNYRCDINVIDNAQRWVPDIRGNSKATGTVDEITFGKSMTRANNNGKDISLPDGENNQERTLPIPGKDEVSFAFLCRVNLPLIITAYQLIAQGKRVCIIGRTQLGGPLKRIITDLCGSNPAVAGYTNRISDRRKKNGKVKKGLMSRLAHYLEMQSHKLSDEKYENKLEALQQNCECIEVIATRIQDDKVSSIIEEIDKLFTEEPTPGVISLSTIHRSKGLEWDVVFILRPDLLPHPRAEGKPEEEQQENNCCYVAATRARHRLYYVSNWPFGSGKSTKKFAEKGIKSDSVVIFDEPFVQPPVTNIQDILGISNITVCDDDNRPF